jgi:hypothetical protein
MHKILTNVIIVLSIIITIGLGISANNLLAKAVKSYPTVVQENLQREIDLVFSQLSKQNIDEETLVDIARNIDSYYGVAAGLYTLGGKELFIMDAIPDNDCPGVPEDFLKLDQIKPNPGSKYTIGTYSFVSDVIGGVNMSHKFWYATHGNYVLVWGVRPDFSSIYLINIMNIRLITMFCCACILIMQLFLLINNVGKKD